MSSSVPPDPSDRHRLVVEPRPEPGASSAMLGRVLDEARELGFLGPGPTSRQRRHAVELARAVGPFAGRFLDLGSGGGLPGLVLAAEFPESTACLLDAQQRRCAFLSQAIERLGLGSRVSVACGRAESLAREPSLRRRFDLVVARSFGPPAVTAECAVGFLRSGGTLVVTEPPGAAASAVRWPPEDVTKLGFGAPEHLRSGETGAVRLVLHDEADERYPRRDGVPAKRPLW